MAILQVTLEKEPLKIQVSTDEGCVGTLILSKEGLGFKIPSGKLESTTRAPWTSLAPLVQAFER